MKKIIYIGYFTVIISCIFYLNCQFVLATSSPYNIELIDSNVSEDEINLVYTVKFDDTTHEICFSGENFMKDYSWTIKEEAKATLSFDGEQIRSFNTDLPLDFTNLDDVIPFDESNFYFIQGYDNKVYLGVRFYTALTIFNSEGKTLTHKPFDEEINYLSYAVNVEDSYIDFERQFYAENNNSIVEEYFYPGESIPYNNGYASLKIEDNKIYGFIISAPQHSYSLLGAVDGPIYLYENEYILYNDEILYKNINTYNIYFRY